jgi:hypothetical protein
LEEHPELIDPKVQALKQKWDTSTSPVAQAEPRDFLMKLKASNSKKKIVIKQAQNQAKKGEASE